MAKWKDVLSNASTYPDDFTVSLKDGQTLTLGEMRSYDREHEGELTATLTKREQALADREANILSAEKNIGIVIEKTAERAGLSVDEFLSGKAPTRKQIAAANPELDENDPLVGTVVKQIKQLQAKIDAQEGTIASLRNDALGPMLNTYLEDYYESRWEKITPSLPKGAKVERQQALEYAQKNGLKDSRGRFDLDKAARELTFDARVEAEAEKRAETLRKKMEDERILAAAPRPNSLGQKVKTDKSLLNDKGQTKSLDEVLNDAMSDTELWRGIQGQA